MNSGHFCDPLAALQASRCAIMIVTNRDRNRKPPKYFMRQRPLGKTGFQVGQIGLGCNRIGDVEETTSADWIALLHQARANGVTLFDTAPTYGHAESETILGEAFGRDQSTLIATKCHAQRDVEPARAYDEKFLRDSCEQSLRKLQRERIDVYQLHSPNETILRQSDWHKVLCTLRDEGKIAAIAVSTNHLPSLMWLLENSLVDVLQIEYSMLAPQLSQIFPLARERDVGILVQMPLCRGILTGKFFDEEVTPNHRARLMGDRLPQLIECAHDFIPLEERYQMPLAHIALQYALSPDVVSCLIPGARNSQQLQDNLAAADAEALLPEMLRDIEAIQSRWID